MLDHNSQLQFLEARLIDKAKKDEAKVGEHQAQVLELNDKLEKARVKLRQREQELEKEMERSQTQEEQSRALGKKAAELAEQLERERAESMRQKERAAELERVAEVHKLEAEIQRARALESVPADQAARLESKVQNLEGTLERERLEMQTKEILMHEERIGASRLATEVVALRSEVTSSNEAMQSLERSLGAMQAGMDINKQLEKERVQQQEEIGKLRKQLGLQEEFMNRAERAAVERLKKQAQENSHTVDDEEIERRIRVDIMARSRQWAHRWAAPRLGGSAAKIHEYCAALQKEFGGIINKRSLMEVVCKRYKAATIVNALLVSFVTNKILRKPFLLFELEAGPTFADKMLTWYQQRLKADKASAHRWRYQELSWLGSSALPLPMGLSSDISIPPVLNSDSEYFANLALDFVNGAARPLLKDSLASESIALGGLRMLFKMAAQAGLLLWRQVNDVQIREFEDLAGYRVPADDGHGKEVVTHPLQRDPSRRPPNNASVDIVVQPSIVVSMENGAEKVWSQAIVLWH
ncbi:hypothetical protein B0T25DRAFT_544198 [Lasiosphaeria hispida]|uniref:Uncharacterized protein n=1 Tax=Lasiosphaeria hispida TaxID=260671 RepID=A0AAJ0HIU1_9PEZI|nr:hypothetical protein B0T25DRAFT_544198 [Lasiosphaeria hispida]